MKRVRSLKFKGTHKRRIPTFSLAQMRIHNPEEYESYKKSRGNVKIEEAKQVIVNSKK